MADIKFKICGNKPPFLAQLYQRYSFGDALFRQTGVDYSGACVTFSSLSPNTCYLIKVTDQINNIITGDTFTPAHYTPAMPVAKTVTLIGTGFNPVVNSCSFKNTSLSISPALQPGESYNVKFCIITCNVTGTDNYATLECQYGTSDYTFLSCHNANSPANPITYCTKTINYGDIITWNLTTRLQTTALEGNGYAVLKIAGVTANTGTFTASIPPVLSTVCKRSEVNYEEPPATTTASPVTSGTLVYFRSLTNEKDAIDPLGTQITWVTSKCLITDRVLAAGQNFDIDVQFYSCTNSTNTVRGVCSYAYYMIGSTKYPVSNATIISGPDATVCNITKTFTNVTKDNISDYKFYSCSVVAKGSDFAKQFFTCGCVNIVRIKNVSTGVVTIDPEGTVTVFSTKYTDGGPATPDGGTPTPV